ncbi:hypothetical protein HEP75_04302 [Xanthomonas sp. SI]|nr:hypothetical protein HEP75_04302 [Xanthomonas sp. SI]
MANNPTPQAPSRGMPHTPPSCVSAHWLKRQEK